MENLRLLNFQTSLDLLKQAEQLLNIASIPKDISDNEKQKLMALTYNNLGCLYKKHKKAIFYAQNCLKKSEQVLSRLKKMPNFSMQEADSGSDHTHSKDLLQKDSYLRNVYTTMTIALYNLGVEHEYLNEYSQAIESFNRAQYLTQEVLDKDPQMTRVINQGLQSVLLKQQKKFIMNNIYGGGSRNQSNSPARLMIDMNSSRFAPIDSKRSVGITNQELQGQPQRYFTKRGEMLANTSTSKLNSSLLREQVNQAYGGQSNNNSNIPNLRNAINNSKLVYQRQERKAQSNLRNQSNLNASPLTYTHYGNSNEDRDRMRRGGGGLDNSGQKYNLINKIMGSKGPQEFTLPTIQNNQRLNQSTYVTNNGYQVDSDSQSSQYDLYSSSQSNIKQNISQFNKTSATQLIRNAASIKQTQISRQPQKIQPMQVNHNNQIPIRKVFESQEYNPERTSVTFGNDLSKPASSSTQYERSATLPFQSHQPFEDEVKMEKTINNINVRLGDLQAKLHNYKIQNDMILEVDNEVSYRNGSTQRSGIMKGSGVASKGISQQPTKQEQKIEGAIQVEGRPEDDEQESVNFDQLSYVSSEAKLV